MKRFLKFAFVDLLWVIFSIPVITGGASTCAAFYVTRKLVDEEECNIAKLFVKAFKQNFVQGTIMFFITAICGCILYFAWKYTAKFDYNKLAVLACVVGTLLLVFINIYVDILISRYENSLGMMIKNSLVISLQFFKKTLTVVVIVAAEILTFVWNIYALIIGLIFIPEIIIYTITKLTQDIFYRLEHPEEFEEISDEEEVNEELEEEADGEESEDESDNEESEDKSEKNEVSEDDK